MTRTARHGGQWLPTATLVAVVALVAFASFVFWAGPRATYRPSPPPLSQTSSAPQPITPREIAVVDGDTIRARGVTIRLVGFDTPESGTEARCTGERELADRATAKLSNLVAGGGLTLRMVACACRPGTEGTRACNYGRSCGYLYAQGRDVGATLIQAKLARPYLCGTTSCPPRQPWC
jgi:endonuclease YncB( thermonuclease family)